MEALDRHAVEWMSGLNWPVVALAGVAVAKLTTAPAKAAIDRPRPPLADGAVHPLIAVPSTASMPSGHALAAFAGAVLLGRLSPRLRLPLFVLQR